MLRRSSQLTRFSFGATGLEMSITLHFPKAGETEKLLALQYCQTVLKTYLHTEHLRNFLFYRVFLLCSICSSFNTKKLSVFFDFFGHFGNFDLQRVQTRTNAHKIHRRSLHNPSTVNISRARSDPLNTRTRNLHVQAPISAFFYKYKNA